MKYRAADSSRKLQEAKLRPVIHIIVIVATWYSACLAGKDPTIHICGSQHAAIQINICSLCKRLCFHIIKIPCRCRYFIGHSIGRLSTQSHMQRMEPFLQGLQYIFQIQVANHTAIVHTYFLCQGIPGRVGGNIIILLCLAGCHPHRVCCKHRQIPDNIVSLPSLKFICDMVSPEYSACAIGEKFQGIHIDLAAAVFTDDFL